jgi:hypothetical protein
MAASLSSTQEAQQAEMTRKKFCLARRIEVVLLCRRGTAKISGQSTKKGNGMAEEKKWRKWEGPGEPEGEGGMSKPEFSQAEDVEGRGTKGFAVCYNCGTGFHSLPNHWRWFTCWKCGALNYYPDEP